MQCRTQNDSAHVRTHVLQNVEHVKLHFVEAFRDQSQPEPPLGNFVQREIEAVRARHDRLLEVLLRRLDLHHDLTHGRLFLCRVLKSVPSGGQRQVLPQLLHKRVVERLLARHRAGLPTAEHCRTHLHLEQIGLVVIRIVSGKEVGALEMQPADRRQQHLPLVRVCEQNVRTAREQLRILSRSNCSKR
eukprot:5509157-Pleurochrysis_carterae.AAC.3